MYLMFSDTHKGAGWKNTVFMAVEGTSKRVAFESFDLRYMVWQEKIPLPLRRHFGKLHEI